MAQYSRDLLAGVSSRSVSKNGREYVLEINSTLGHTAYNPPTSPAIDFTFITLYPEDMVFDLDDSFVVTDASSNRFIGVRDKRKK